MTQESDILVNRVKEQHECQTIRQQQSSESAHCASEGLPLALKLNCSRRVAPPGACPDLYGVIVELL